MSDEYAIQQLLNCYSIGASRADWDAVLSTFATDGIWEVPARGMRLQGHEPIRATMIAFVGSMSYFVQLNSPATISVQGDRASARSVIRECGKFADRDEAMEVLGFYEDEIIRIDGKWKFARRRFIAAGIHRFALLAGPAF